MNGISNIHRLRSKEKIKNAKQPIHTCFICEERSKTLRELIKQYGEYIYHLAYLYVKDKESAEEIAQDVFINFDKKRDQFRGEAQLKTYLTRMTINRAHDEIRKMKRKVVLESLLPFLKSAPSAESKIVQEEIGNSVRHAVFALPIHYREIIILHYYEDFSVIEITNLLQLSENTIRTRLRRAKQQLKMELGEYMEEGLLHE